MSGLNKVCVAAYLLMTGFGIFDVVEHAAFAAILMISCMGFCLLFRVLGDSR